MQQRIVMVLLLSFLSASVFAQLPRYLPYQGVYTDTLGNPKGDGTHTFTFRLYDVSAGGSALWTEIKDLQVKRGFFQTNLGDTSPFGAGIAFDRQYYLGVKPGADPELSPRIALLPVASSLFAVKSDTSRNVLTIPDNVVTSAKIAASAVTSPKILDEPGIDFVECSAILVAISTEATTSQMASITISAPAAGYVFLVATGSVALNRTSDTHDMVRIKVSATANDVSEAVGLQILRFQAGVGSGNIQFPFSASKVRAVSAGSRTFYLNLWHQVQAGAAYCEGYSLSAQYFPTRY